MTSKLNVLFLCNKPPVGCDANTIVDHIEAFESYSNHNIWLYSNLGNFSKKLDLNRFDVVIIHYSLFILSSSYLGAKAKKKLQDYQGLKVIFIQDEYRRIDQMGDELAYLGIDVLFTCFPEAEFNNIYPLSKLPKLSKYNNLTGYVPKRLTEITNQPLIKDRARHVGYRGRKLPYWYGALGCDKWQIVEKWHKHVSDDTGISFDISAKETDRIYGGAWVDFLSSSKATLGVESGTSVMDFTGALEQAVENYQLLNPHASFEEVQQKYFVKEEGRHKLNQISPRCFEAIALKTALVLFEGEYSDILIPGQHYIELKKDFSNIDKVLSCLKDDKFLQAMVDRAFDEVALNPQYGYEAFIGRVDHVLTHEFIERQKQQVEAYEPEIFYKVISYSTLRSKLLAIVLPMYQKLPWGIRLLIKCTLRPKQIYYPMRRAYKKLFRHDKTSMSETSS